MINKNHINNKILNIFKKIYNNIYLIQIFINNDLDKTTLDSISVLIYDSYKNIIELYRYSSNRTFIRKNINIKYLNNLINSFRKNLNFLYFYIYKYYYLQNACNSQFNYMNSDKEFELLDNSEYDNSNSESSSNTDIKHNKNNIDEIKSFNNNSSENDHLIDDNFLNKNNNSSDTSNNNSSDISNNNSSDISKKKIISKIKILDKNFNFKYKNIKQISQSDDIDYIIIITNYLEIILNNMKNIKEINYLFENNINENKINIIKKKNPFENFNNINTINNSGKNSEPEIDNNIDIDNTNNNNNDNNNIIKKKNKILLSTELKNKKIFDLKILDIKLLIKKFISKIISNIFNLSEICIYIKIIFIYFIIKFLLKKK